MTRSEPSIPGTFASQVLVLCGLLLFGGAAMALIYAIFKVAVLVVGLA